MRKAMILAALASILFGGWGCQGGSVWKGSRETVDGVEIVRNPKTPMYPEGALELREELTIGKAEGAEEYMFERLRWLDVDGQGAIFALDQKKPLVSVFSETGEYLRSFGRRGQGPGEFQTPFFVSLAPSGELMVGEMSRLSFFDHSGAFLRSKDNTVGPLAFVKFLDDGDAVGHRMVLEEKNPRYEVVLCGPDLKPRATLSSSPMPNPSGKYDLFANVARWDVVGGREIVCGSGQDGYRLSVFDAAGRLVRKIENDYDPVPVTDADVERQMKQHGFQSRDEITYPHDLPPIWWLYADREGRTYVATWRKDPGSGVSLFNIFDQEGRYLCDCHMPGEPLVIRNGKLYAIVRDDEGYQYIKRYRMIWKH
jgi:hypothetical protein